MSKDIQNMTDGEASSFLGEHAGSQRTIHSTTPRKDSANTDLVDITALVRSVQRAEGNRDCFRRGQVACDQTDCFWRKYCLKGDTPDGEKGR